MDFLKSFSTSLNSSESRDNGTRWYFFVGGMEDQWLGILVARAFLPCWMLTAFWDLKKKLVTQWHIVIQVYLLRMLHIA